MTGTSCAFILTKSSDLSLYYFPFFLLIYDYVVINNKYHEASGYVGRFDPENT
jgi:hypothetical protein